MIRLDLSTTYAAGLDMLLNGGEFPSSPDDAGLVRMTFSLPSTPPATHWLKHLPAPASEPGHRQNLVPTAIHETFAITLDQQLERGIVGPVFAGSVDGALVVAKVALYEAETRILLHEAAIYRRLARLQGRVVPRIFGVFSSRCRGFTVLVMAHHGTPVAQIGELSASQRSALHGDLKVLHQCGILHGDLRAENVVVSDSGTPSLIDFSHARTHQCPGPAVCEELRGSRSFFLL